MHQIQKMSKFLLIIFNILLVGIPLTISIIWLWIDSNFIKNLINISMLFKPFTTPEGVVFLNEVKWTTTSKFIAYIGNMVGMLPVFLSLFSLKVIFKNYEKGEIFTVHNAQHYRRLGLLFFLDALIIQLVSPMLMILAVTLSNPPGHRYISLSFGTPNLEVMFFGLLVMVISWVMLEGSRLQDEQRFTV